MTENVLAVCIIISTLVYSLFYSINLGQHLRARILELKSIEIDCAERKEYERRAIICIVIDIVCIFLLWWFASDVLISCIQHLLW